MDPIGTDHTSYHDLKGVISIDFEGDLSDGNLQSYARSLGIDTGRYSAFGIELVAIEEDAYEDAEVRILAHDLQENRNIVRFKEKDTFKNLLKHIWRLSITVTEEGFTENTKLKLHREIGKEERL